MRVERGTCGHLPLLPRSRLVSVRDRPPARVRESDMRCTAGVPLPRDDGEYDCWDKVVRNSQACTGTRQQRVRH